LAGNVDPEWDYFTPGNIRTYQLRFMIMKKRSLLLCGFFLLLAGIVQAQFKDDFDKRDIRNWQFFTGDGFATMEFLQKEGGYASIQVDATKDPFNVWYAITKRNVAPYLDLNGLKGTGTELRVEARVRIFNPPHRVNFMVNTQKTTDFHHDLMEFELPDTAWHVISMTTRDLDAVPGDSVYIQLNVTDFGWEKYRVDVDYIRADIINTQRAGRDKGIQIPYHPPIPPVNAFSDHVAVQHDALINTDYPQVNLADWQVREKEGPMRVLTVSGNQWAVMRWNLEKYRNAKAAGAGLLEITTQALSKGGNYIQAYGQQLGEEFPRVRVIEIFGGPQYWDQEGVTYESFMQGKPYAAVFNTQMIYDKEVAEIPGSKNYITISQPVMQRLLNGTTKGLLIRPLGAITASFYASENQDGQLAPKLHFSIAEQ
jgi:hypothetical protein